MSQLICIVCRTNPVNPMISGTDGPDGKSFCSRSCQQLWMRHDLEFMDQNKLKELALTRLEELRG